MENKGMKATIRYQKRQRTIVGEQVVQEDAVIEMAFDQGRDADRDPPPEAGMDPGRVMLPRPTKPLPRSRGVRRPQGAGNDA